MSDAHRIDYDPWLPFDPAREQEDRRAIRELQAHRPVVKRPDGAWLVTGAAGARQVLERIDEFGGTFGDYSALDSDEIILPGLPEPLHSIVRRGVNASVAHHRSVNVIPYLRDLSRRLLGAALEACREDGVVDLYGRVLRDIPAAVIARLLGAPEEDRVLFTRWGDELIERQMQGDNFDKSVGDLHPEFAAYLDAHIARRKTGGDESEDAISRMIRVAEERGSAPLSDRMIRTQLMNLLVAGNETTRNLLGNLFYRLASQPDVVKKLREAPSLVENFVEESLRFESPVRFLVRRCSKATTLEGEKIDQGDTLLVSLEAANRDPAAFERPDEFDMRRAQPRSHLAFGAGPHICAGAFVARLEGRTVVEAFLEMVAQIRLVDGASYVPHPISWARGPIELPVVLTPAAEKPNDGQARFTEAE